MFNLIISMVTVALVTFIVYDFVMEFKAATGTTWERLLAAGKQTETILWARFVALVGCLTQLLVQGADWLNAPGVADSIRTVMKPEYVAVYIVAIAFVTEFARRHNATDVK